MKKTFLAVSLAVMMIFGVMSSASALTITPDTMPQWTGDETSNAEILAAISVIMGFDAGSNELYKSNVGGVDEGPYVGSYMTTYSNTPADPSNALIEYVSGPVINFDPVWLLLKDGNQVPAWYLYNLSLVTGGPWNGTDDIEMLGFWPAGGSISHVALYGNVPRVPEPMTLVLLGLGLVGLAAVRRKF